jgi:hypothetical protein
MASTTRDWRFFMLFFFAMTTIATTTMLVNALRC